MEQSNFQNKGMKGSGYFSMILIALLLIISILFTFILLKKFDDFIFITKEQKIESVNLKNILLILMENYEKKLLETRLKLQKEKEGLFLQLNNVDSKKVREIRAKIKQIEENEKSASFDLKKISDDKNALENEIAKRNEFVDRLTKEKENMGKEVVDLKINYASYIQDIKNEFLDMAQDQTARDVINTAFTKDNAKGSIKTMVNLLLKNPLNTNEQEKFISTEENDHKLQNESESVINNLIEITAILTDGDRDLLDKINTERDKNDTLNYYIKEIKNISNLVIKEKNEKLNDAINNQKNTVDSKELRKLQETIEILKRQNTALTKSSSKNNDAEIKNLQATIEKLESENENLLKSKKTGNDGEITKLMDSNEKLKKENIEFSKTINDQLKENTIIKTNLTNAELNLKNKDNEIQFLLDLNQINGYFINKNESIDIIFNKKKKNEIIKSGTFNVYDNKKNIVSKIYLSVKDDAIIITKLPGYNMPNSGDWF